MSVLCHIDDRRTACMTCLQNAVVVVGKDDALLPAKTIIETIRKDGQHVQLVLVRHCLYRRVRYGGIESLCGAAA